MWGHPGNHLALEPADCPSRPYTPLEWRKDGSVVLIVKAYPPTEAFPEGGRTSQALGALHPGAKVKARGPLGTVRVDGQAEHP